jgi:hypothetical protein
MHAKLCYFIPILFITGSNLLAQDLPSVAAAKQHLIGEYNKSTRGESLLYVGSDYAEYESISGEHPYFKEDDWMTGAINYNGTRYNNVPLQYDLSSQKLITEHITSGKKIQLVAEHVSWFSVDGHYFEYINRVNTKDVTSGFYEVLANGSVKLLARRGKALQESTVTGKLEARFEESVNYFILKDDVFYPVRGKKSILNALKDKRSMLVAEVKRNRVKFGKDKQQALIKTVELYNEMNP